MFSDFDIYDFFDKVKSYVSYENINRIIDINRLNNFIENEITEEIRYLIIGILLFILIFIIYFLYNRNRNVTKNIFWKDDKSKLKNNYYLNENRKKQGKEYFYYRSGVLNKESYWMNGKKEGEEIIYYENGNVYIQKNYKEGVLNGIYIVFNIDGKILEKSIYQKGDLVSNENFAEKKWDRDVCVQYKPIVSNDEMWCFSSAERDYKVVKKEEDTKDEEKKVSGVWSGLKKIGRVATGYQAYQNRKSVKRIREVCERLYENAIFVTKRYEENFRNIVSEVGQRRVVTLQNTTGKFLELLKDIGSKNKKNEYKFTKGIKAVIKYQKMKNKGSIDMDTAEVINGIVVIGGASSVFGMAVPGLVTKGVVALGAKASTGTAIATLSGITKTNAILAWFGGGSLAAGGGGMAVGTAVITGMKAVATGGLSLVLGSLYASSHYNKKLTEIKKYQKGIEWRVEKIKTEWSRLDKINDRINELELQTTRLEKRILEQFIYLNPLSVDFDSKDIYYAKIFNKTGLLIKSINELVQVPLLDKKGNLTNENLKVKEKIGKILNTEL